MIGRTATCYVSAHYPDRVHDLRIWRVGKRTVKAEFSGTLDAGVTITSVTWALDCLGVVSIGNPTLAAKSTTVDVTAIEWGEAFLRCAATLSDGQVVSQLFRAASLGSNWFSDPTGPAGPSSLTVNA